MRPYFQATVESPFIDLHDGFDGFVQQCARSGSDLVKSIAQKTRKMSREIAPMRFEAHRQDRSALDRLFAWKAAQRERTGTFDVLSTPWMRNVAARLLDTTTETFAGLLSVLYAGDQVAAVHLGMRSDTVWHRWFAAYNHDLQRYSPGLINLLEMVRAAPGLLGVNFQFPRSDSQAKERSVWKLAVGSWNLGIKEPSAPPAPSAGRFAGSGRSGAGRRISRTVARGGTSRCSPRCAVPR